MDENDFYHNDGEICKQDDKTGLLEKLVHQQDDKKAD